MMLEERDDTCTPCWRTAEGSVASAWETRFCTFTAASTDSLYWLMLASISSRAAATEALRAKPSKSVQLSCGAMV